MAGRGTISYPLRDPAIVPILAQRWRLGHVGAAMGTWSTGRRRLRNRIRPFVADLRIYATKLRPAEVRVRLEEQLPTRQDDAEIAPRRLLPKRARLASLDGSVWGDGFELWKLTPYGIEQAAVAIGGFAVEDGRTWIVVRIDFLKGWYRTLLAVSLLPVLLALGRTDELTAASIGLVVHVVGFFVEYRRARVHGRYLRRTLAESLFADEVPLTSAPRFLRTVGSWPRRRGPSTDVQPDETEPAR